MTLATTQHISAEMFEAMPQTKRLELVRGELQEQMATGGEHGACTSRFGSRLAVYVEDNNLGEVLAAETGFIVDRNPDSVRAPDVAFLSTAQLELLGGLPKGFIPIAPELVAETISPNDLYTESHDKALMWLEFGVRVVLLLDPRKARVTVYRAKNDIVVLEDNALLEFGDVVAGFSIALPRIFR
jgi:Uma2 family endonuclease